MGTRPNFGTGGLCVLVGMSGRDKGRICACEGAELCRGNGRLWVFVNIIDRCSCVGGWHVCLFV